MVDDNMQRPVLTGDEGDDTLRRVRATLAPLPAVNPMAVARVLAAVHGRAPSPWTRWTRAWSSLRQPGLSLIGGSTLLAAALVGIVVVRNSDQRGPSVAAAPSVLGTDSITRAADLPPGTASPNGAPVGSGAATVQAASTGADPEAAVPVQFVLDAATATSVSVVGDFNDWSAGAAPMQRLPGSRVWMTTLAVSPGRHVYAFIVDGRTWMPDPRAPRAADSDFGKPGSVLLVVPR